MIYWVLAIIRGIEMEKFVMKKKFFLFTLIACWCIGIGFRGIMDSSGNVPMFDKFFDWGILFFLGLSLFIYTIYSVTKDNKKC